MRVTAICGSDRVRDVASGRKNCIRIKIYGTKQSVWWDSQDPDELHIGRRDAAAGHEELLLCEAILQSYCERCGVSL